ncbi:MAG: hypothetical protein LBT79_07420 [Elusimicrobiota bacterium]|jgi:hypothetical protein|nr:hypothetical protein [Elusimicrobiota bacterium]
MTINRESKRDARGRILPKKTIDPNEPKPLSSFADDKAKKNETGICNRCKSPIKPQDKICENCLAPTSWKR